MNRSIAVGLVLLFVAIQAVADPNNLEDGVFIVHVPTIECMASGDPPAGGWCQRYQDDCAISAAYEQVNRIDVTGYAPNFMFVLAAWEEEKTWAGAEFGLGDFDPALFGFLDWAPCFQDYTLGLEIPTPGWPGPNEGVALAAGAVPWGGNYLPIYYFVGYAYGYHGAGTIPLDVDPPTGFAGTANALIPATQYPVVCFGALGINREGSYCEPPTYMGVATEARETDLAMHVLNPSTEDDRITYRIPPWGAGRPMDLSVFDVSGRLVRTLARGPHAAGEYEVRWNDRTAAQAGLYFARLTIGSEMIAQRLIVLR